MHFPISSGVTFSGNKGLLYIDLPNGMLLDGKFLFGTKSNDAKSITSDKSFKKSRLDISPVPATKESLPN